MHISQLLPLCSLLYLALPYFLFACGWLKSWLAAVFMLCLLAGLILSGKEILRWPPPPGEKKGWRMGMEWGLTLLIAVAWVSLSGVSGMGFMNLDYPKHHAILKDLIVFPWPVYYSDVPRVESHYFQCYYIAWYLPAALIGKAGGWIQANHTLYVWTIMGVYLSLRWFRRCVGTDCLIIYPLFVFLGGLDVIGGYLSNHEIRDGTMHIEWWIQNEDLPEHLRRIFQYSSNSTLLCWVPQHCLPGWILTGLIMNLSLQQVSRRIMFFAAALSGLWSPFITIGLIPIILASLYRSRIHEAISFQNLVVAPLILVIIALFLASHIPQMIPHGAIWNLYDFYALWPKYLLFLVLEVFVFAIFCIPSLPQWRGRGTPLFILALVTLTVLPLYRVGANTDLMMRASIPSLFVLWVFLLGTLTSREGVGLNPQAKRGVLVLLLVASIGGGSEIARSLNGYCSVVPHWDGISSVVQLWDGVRELYFGDEDSFFFRHLAPPRESPHQLSGGIHQQANRTDEPVTARDVTVQTQILSIHVCRFTAVCDPRNPVCDLQTPSLLPVEEYADPVRCFLHHPAHPQHL